MRTPESQPRKLCLPAGANNNVKEVDCKSSVVMLGANGAGKTRIGTWMETKGPQTEIVHRIAAQRSLVFPSTTSPIGLDSAERNFMWAEIPSNWDLAAYERSKSNLKIQRKYGGGVTGFESHPVNDYKELMVLLFSENYAGLQQNEEDFYESGIPSAPPQSRLRRLKSIWEDILPHRRLKFDASDVIVHGCEKESDKYNAKNLSDGERVLIYLIGQVLCAPDKSIIIIDEPELHLHKSIQDRLWQYLEAERDDCLFVYLTHDLGFATSRYDCTKIFIKSFDGKTFDWQVIPDNQELPEHLLLELIGSRKPVIFVEGDYESKDIEIYKLAYPNYLIKPVGSCVDVIQATKAFSRLHGMHQLKCYGIIDRDYLSEGQIESYERNNIFCLKVSEIENLFLVPELIEAVADRLLLDQNDTLENVKSFVIDSFERELNEHAMNFAKHRISLLLGSFSSKAKTLTDFEFALHEFTNQMNAELFYNDAIHHGNEIIANKDYTEVLRVYNKKDLTKKINHLFSLKGQDANYVEKVRQMNKMGVCNIGSILSKYIPTLI